MSFAEVHHVRDVAGRKQMFCATFQLPDEFLFFSVPKKQVGETKSIERAEGDEYSNGSSNDECVEGTCKKQIEGLQPMLKKKKVEEEI